jgi:hypothetical protein
MSLCSDSDTITHCLCPIDGWYTPVTAPRECQIGPHHCGDAPSVADIAVAFHPAARAVTEPAKAGQRLGRSGAPQHLERRGTPSGAVMVSNTRNQMVSCAGRHVRSPSMTRTWQAPMAIFHPNRLQRFGGATSISRVISRRRDQRWLIPGNALPSSTGWSSRAVRLKSDRVRHRPYLQCRARPHRRHASWCPNRFPLGTVLGGS